MIVHDTYDLKKISEIIFPFILDCFKQTDYGREEGDPQIVAEMNGIIYYLVIEDKNNICFYTEEQNLLPVFYNFICSSEDLIAVVKIIYLILNNTYYFAIHKEIDILQDVFLGFTDYLYIAKDDIPMVPLSF